MPATLHGQTSGPADSLATLRLVRAAQTARLAAPFGTAYRAAAEGHVYFFLDREDGGAPVPIRVDQVALDLYRSRSGQTRQLMRGLRRKEFLPVRDFDYYIDRLTVVQNGFGDRIVVGEGRDVRGVPHPLGAGAEERYRYRIVDSLRVQVPTLPSPVRVYEVEVHPRDGGTPAFVGSVFLEAETGGLVRMDFTFTPASYVDPRTDRATVRLEHALWEGRYWLPYRQTVEVRRETPEVDLPVGSVIRAKLEVTEYDFAAKLGDDFFRGPAVVRLPYGSADSTAFRTGLADRMAEEGLSPVSMAKLEAEARSAARTRLASGLPRLRLYADGVSSVLRANAAEGVYVGLGASYSPSGRTRLEALGGVGTWNRKASGVLRAKWLPEWSLAGSRVAATVEVFGRQLRDAGPRPGASGAVNTLAALAWQRDYSDPFFASGARVSLTRRGAGGNVASVAGFAERHSGASASWFERERSGGAAPPPPAGGIRQAADGVLWGAQAGYSYRWGGSGAWGAEAGVRGTAGRWEGVGTASLTVRIEGRTTAVDLSRWASASVEAGRSWGATPSHLLFFVGGRGTLPGHPFREYGGREFVLARAEASATLVPGWLAIRGLAGAGAAGMATDDSIREWGVLSTGGVRGYVGAGLATLYETVRIDGAWGFPGGRFELVVSVDQWLRPYL